MDKILPQTRILGREGFKFYKQNCNKALRNKKIHRDNHSQIVSAIFRNVAQKLLHNTSGVFLTGIGYFCIMMYPKRMMLRNKYSKTGAKHLNVDTDYRNYSPQWISKMYPSFFYTWTLDRTFSDTNIRRPLAQLLRAGKKYIMEYTLVRSLKESKYNK
jgi:hypothetical protein